jgi:hypothetical protein
MKILLAHLTPGSKQPCGPTFDLHYDVAPALC